uniref:EOG090X0F7F n=1 Tax=Alona affinis TaxID=381656 RepID=A0A9N6WPD6_9CRUS|nr:EOG090X0F7F [Alona affinis]
MSTNADGSVAESQLIKFKKPQSKKPLRQRREIAEEEKDDDDEQQEEVDILSKLEETKEMQKLRERPHGISAVALARGKPVTTEEEITNNDPFKVNSGGMADMKAIKTGKPNSAVDDAYETGIGTQFSVETNTRDEDAEMMKYIEEQLAKRKGLEKEDDNTNKYMTPEEVAFSSVPEYLRKKSSVQSEEMLSNQMLSGIPEVDLGIEAKIKNIEATEEAKQKLLQERLRKKDGPSAFVPTNMAVNFVQHNRFNIEESGPNRKRRAEEAAAAAAAAAKPLPDVQIPTQMAAKRAAAGENVVGGKKENDKASDDFYFEKFRRQFRR